MARQKKAQIFQGGSSDAGSADAAQAKATLGEQDAGAAPAMPPDHNLTAAFKKILEMTDAQLTRHRERTNLTQRERIALRWFDKLEQFNDRGGPQVFAETLDRVEGKVVLTHRLVGAGDRGNLPDTELDKIWRRRQSRQASGQDLTH